ncbi:MAG: hypothetical protein ACSLE9_09130 [Burkholderiaceae bacterium]
MTDKEFKRERKRIRALAAKWRDPLRLFEWEVELRYSRGPFEVNGTRDSDAVGMASVQWPYRKATLTFDVTETAGYSDAYLEQVFVHECVHVIVNEMRDDEGGSCLHEERVVSTLTTILLPLGRR